MLLLHVNNFVGIFTRAPGRFRKRKWRNILEQRANNRFGLPLWFVNHTPDITVRKFVLGLLFQMS